MSCPDVSVLWSLEAGELSANDHAAELVHARSCLACQVSQRELRDTFAMLRHATGTPSITWQGVDDAVERETQRRALGHGRWKLAVPLLLATAAALIAFTVTRPTPRDETPSTPIVTAVQVHEDPAPKVEPRVVTAPTKASPIVARTAARSFIDGESLRAVNGRLDVDLTSGDKFTVLEGGQVTLSRGALALNDGSLITVANKRVRILGGSVRISGSASTFSVTRGEDFVEVAVAYGAVLVETSASDWAHAGESIRVQRGQFTKRALSAQQRDVFSAAGITVQAEDTSDHSAESQFLSRAESALKSGKCGDFLLGLETLAFDAEAVEIREHARILKARCHDERLEPEKADIEYRRYLRDFPEGPAASEATRAVSQ